MTLISLMMPMENGIHVSTDPTAIAVVYRQRASDARLKAAKHPDPAVARIYLNIAGDYENLARCADTDAATRNVLQGK